MAPRCKQAGNPKPSGATHSWNCKNSNPLLFVCQKTRTLGRTERQNLEPCGARHARNTEILNPASENPQNPPIQKIEKKNRRARTSQGDVFLFDPAPESRSCAPSHFCSGKPKPFRANFTKRYETRTLCRRNAKTLNPPKTTLNRVATCTRKLEPFPYKTE